MNLRKIAPSTIRGNLFLLVAAVLLPFLFILSALGYGEYRQQISGELKSEMEEARALGMAFGSFVKDVYRQEEAVGLALLSINRFSGDTVNHLLMESANEYECLRSFSFISPEGKILSSSDPRAIGLDISDRLYLRQAIISETAISDLLVSKVDGGLIISIARRVRNPDGSLKGIILATVNPAALPLELSMKRFGGGRLVIFDSRGQLVFSADPWAMEAHGVNWSAQDSILVKALKGVEAQGVIASPVDGSRLIVARVPVKLLSWVAGASRPREEVVGGVLHTLRMAGAWLFLMLLFSITIAIVLSRKITGPITRLEARAIAVSTGSGHAAGPIGGTKELVSLHLAFDNMASQLKSINNSLEQRVDHRTSQLHAANELLLKEIRERRRVERELTGYKEHLEELVGLRTAELETTNNHLLKEIEERKRAQAQVTSIARFPAENPSPELRINEQMVLVYANESSRDLLREWGCRSGETVPKEIGDRVKSVLSSGVSTEYEITINERIYSLILSPSVPDGDVNVYGRDITGRKASQYVRGLLEASLDPLVSISPEGRITDVNAAMEKATGLIRSQIMGTDFSNYFADPAKAREGFALALKAGLVRDQALTLLHVSGRTMDVLYNAAVYRDAAGEIQGIFAAARDITERKRLEERLRKAEQMKLLGQLTSGVAHEVRNPLNAIMAVTEALFEEIGDNPDYNPYMVHIRSQVERLSALMTDLLELGKPINESRLVRISLSSILTNVLSAWQHSPLKDKCVIHRLQPSSARQWYVLADPGKIQQVFYNLLENACQNGPPGSDIHFFISSPRENIVTVRVVDQGPGIPHQNTERVFEPFFTTRKGGIGLGLSIVKHVLALHHGEIVLRNNEPPPGLTAEIRLPLAAEMAGEQA